MRNGVSFYKFCKKKILRFDVGAFLLGDVFITSNDASIDGTTLTLLRMLSILLSKKISCDSDKETSLNNQELL